MAIRNSTTLFKQGRDDDRLTGFKKKTLSAVGEYNSGVDELIGGMVVCSDGSVDPTGLTIHLFNGQSAYSSANGGPLGLVYENTRPFPQTSGDESQGRGGDTLDYARGNIYSIFHRPGNFVDIWDDGRNTAQIGNASKQNFSCPFVATESFVAGTKVFATDSGSDYGMGRLTTTATSATALIGIVRASLDGATGADQQFTLELTVQSL